MIGEMELRPTDIISIIHQAGVKSFSEVESNKKSISECGWFPYIQNILLHKQFCDTMTMKDIETGKNCSLVPSTFIESKSSVESINSNESDSCNKINAYQLQNQNHHSTFYPERPNAA